MNLATSDSDLLGLVTERWPTWEILARLAVDLTERATIFCDPQLSIYASKVRALADDIHASRPRRAAGGTAMSALIYRVCRSSAAARWRVECASELVGPWREIAKCALMDDATMILDALSSAPDAPPAEEAQP